MVVGARGRADSNPAARLDKATTQTQIVSESQGESNI
jgi:hypothetical protein